MTQSSFGEALTRLWPHGDRPEDDQVHAIVDGARDPRIFELLLRTGLEYTCLFAGRLSPSLRAAAPYLVHLAPGVNFTRQFFSEGWGNSWGVLTVAPADVTLPRLRRHLRTLLRVQDEAGRKLLFRFYDPRVLRVYLPTCTGDDSLPANCLKAICRRANNFTKRVHDPAKGSMSLAIAQGGRKHHRLI
jgi:hypothetical protein